MVYVAGSVSTSLAWDQAIYARAFRRMASFSHLVTYDQRGMGYSDRVDVANPPTVEDLAGDLAAVIEAAGLRDPVLFGSHNGGAVAAVYATTQPVRQLVLCNTWARLSIDHDYPIGFPEVNLDKLEERYRTIWGRGAITERFASPRPEIAADRIELASTSRNQVVTLFQMNRQYDIRAVLPSITAPTLVIHLEDNRSVPPSFGRFIAEAIPGARLALVPGTDQVFLRNYADPVIDELEPFVTGSLTHFDDTVTTTMLFTDIVDSTSRAAALGDESWATLIDQHNTRVRQQIRDHGGDEMKCTGDGFVASFEDPASAIACALAAMASVEDLGLELRAGVHVGAVTRMGQSDVSGLAVHFAQRLCALAADGQVLTSAIAMEQCEGSGISFSSQGTVSLRGIPGQWQIYDAMVITP